jgi:hypothetical protein
LSEHTKDLAASYTILAAVLAGFGFAGYLLWVCLTSALHILELFV